MLANAWFIARSDLRQALRHKETWIWTFAMPLAFFYFFSAIQGGSGSGAAEKTALTLVVPDQGGVLVDELERRLVELDYAVTRVAALDPAAKAPARVLEVPADFSAGVLAGREQTLELVREEGGNPAELDRFRVTRAAWAVLADVIATAARGDEQGAEAYRALAQWPRALSFASRPAGERQRIPSGKEQSIPGTLVMFTLIVLLTSGVIGIVIERRLGLLRRLASAPLSRSEIVLGKWLGALFLGLVQVGYGMLAGSLVFDLDWGPDLPVVLVVLGAWAAFSTSLAVLLAGIVESEGQAVGIGVLTANVLAALGGCWWPIEVTPPWMQSLASVLPSGAVMNALHRLVIFQTGPAGALPALTYLAVGALLLGWIGARRFRYH